MTYDLVDQILFLYAMEHINKQLHAVCALDILSDESHVFEITQLMDYDYLHVDS